MSSQSEQEFSRSGRCLNKLYILMWKNYKLQIRHPIRTLIEILIPTVFCVILVVARYFIKPDVTPEPTYPVPPPEPIDMTKSAIFKNYTLAYSPKNTHLERIVRDTAASLNVTNPIISFLNNKTLMQNLLNQSAMGGECAGIQFDDLLVGNVDLPKKLHVVLRTSSDVRLPTSLSQQDSWQTNALYRMGETSTFPEYYWEGRLGIQQALSLSIIQHLRKSFEAPRIMMKAVHVKKDVFMVLLILMLPHVMLFSFVYPFVTTVTDITVEKELQLKEAMKIMGLSNWLHWTAWFLKTFILFMISVIIMVFLLKTPFTIALLPNSNAFALLVFFAFYMCSIITYAFAISALLCKASIAGVLSAIAYLLPYIMVNIPSKILSCFGMHAAFIHGLISLGKLELDGTGLQMKHLFQKSTPIDGVSFNTFVLMLVIDTVLYLLIALYVESVCPGKFGVPRVWYFPFLSRCFRKNRKITALEYDEELAPLAGNASYEKEPDHLVPGIQIRKLRKSFSKQMVAVKELSLNMFKGQITVLLGHNGAGKTTTISMLIGVYPPTSGTALIDGYDIRTQMDKIRYSTGFCPQHNILFDELTVEEHLYFYSKLKGLKKDEVKSEIQKFLHLLELESKAKIRSSKLSGGMKRRLCVGIAFCGNSKVVMLDEPTSGLDPGSRRGLWDLIQQERKGRTILLTTHFMDEADVLGDRIAIMAGGELQCVGSSFFLKKRYGTGYHLTIGILPNCKPKDVTALLKKHVENIRLENSYNSELTYLLSDSDASHFEDMLNDLESKSKQVGIENYGISLTTLEEVFMKVGTDYDEEEIDYRKKREEEANKAEALKGTSTASEREISDRHDLYTGVKLYRAQFLAMVLKKCLIIRHSWIPFLIHFFLFTIMLSAGLIYNKITSKDSNKPTSGISYDENPAIILNGTNKYHNRYVENLQKRYHPYANYKNEDFSVNIIDMTKQNPSASGLRTFVGATFHENNSITALFNKQTYQSHLLALKLAIDAIVATELGSDYSIDIANYSLPSRLISTKFDKLSIVEDDSLISPPKKESSKNKDELKEFEGYANMCTGFYFSYCIFGFIKERASNSKHLQLVSGVNLIIFLLAIFVCEYIIYITMVLCVSFELEVFGVSGYKPNEHLSGVTLVILICFGFAMVPLMYLFAYLFKSPSRGYVAALMLSMTAEIISNAIEQVKVMAQRRNVAEKFFYFPYYSLPASLQNSHEVFKAQKLCQALLKFCVETSKPPQNTVKACEDQICTLADTCCGFYSWKQPGVLKNIVIFLFTGIISITLICIVEQNVCQKLLAKLNSFCHKRPVDDENEDGDVRDERLKVRSLTQDEISAYAIVLKDVSKYYRRFLAVNNICLSVSPFECFGLLGVNGAGKTTTFKMMTGEVSITFGEVWVKGFSLKRDIQKVHQQVGYCPQFDALLNNLTAKETLRIFCILRGVPVHDCEREIEKISQEFDFHKHLHKLVKKLSGGNKRKLSTAVAVVGCPPIIFLDEPTTGMDPASKRHIWDALGRIREKGSCIILTTHSMEECEALCSRIVIMVNGQFKCLGSKQHLKSKFSKEYTLMIKLRKTDNVVQTKEIENIEKFIKSSFPAAILKEQIGQMLTYDIPEGASAPKMFGIMEKAKKALNIEDYALGQSTLEQVFFKLSKQQK